MSDSLRGAYAAYAPEQDIPLGSYATLLGVFGLGAALSLAALSRADRLRAPTGADLMLLGVATHKMTRVVTQDWVTSPLRAPFVEYNGPKPGGEVDERPRGSGMQRAMGDLLTCSYCTGPWVAGGLAVAHAAAPKATRFVASVFAAVTVSDFLHRAYAWLGKRSS